MKQKIINFLKEWIPTLIIALVLVFIVNTFVVMQVQVDGSSMYPTLQDKDRGLSFVYNKSNLNRFDIVVIKNPSNGESNFDKNFKIVKRIIGLPNETIEYKDNKLYVNGNFIEEYFLNDTYTYDYLITLKEDEYLCLGDNRNNSMDSRNYGPFNKSQIISKSVFVLYPFNRFGIK